METFTPRLDILPVAQRQLWPELRSIQQHGFVLYGGTAIALRLGHRQSVDFDFFSAQRVDAQRLRTALPFVKAATVRQESTNTLEVETQSGVKVAFFGGLEFGRVGQPQRTTDGVLRVASLDDLMATKVKVILQRSEAKDYRDIAAMVRAEPGGADLPLGAMVETPAAAVRAPPFPWFASSPRAGQSPA
jgi:predicted nucleotidyltransferase component of viral defense system